MTAAKESISSWVSRLKGDPALAKRVEYRGRIPSVGSHYRFIYRLSGQRVTQKRALRDLQISRRSKSRAWGSSVSEVKRKRVRQRAWESEDFIQTLNRFLMRVSVESWRRGLLPAPGELLGHLDGSVYQSWGNSQGKRVCACGISKCTCPRAYSDPDAGLIYKQKQYQFGYQLIGLTAEGRAGQDLPLFLQVKAPTEGELPASIEAMERFARLGLGERLGLKKRHPLWAVAADLNYDAIPFYRQLSSLGIKSVVPLLKAAKKEIPARENEPPRCPSGQAMIRHSDLKDYGICYRCPARVATRKGGKFRYVFKAERCHLETPCDSTRSIGPTVYRHEDSKRRLHPSIPRDSQEFKDLYKRRLSIERFFGWLKTGFSRKTRSLPVAQLLLTCRAMVKHMMHWGSSLPVFQDSS